MVAASFLRRVAKALAMFVGFVVDRILRSRFQCPDKDDGKSKGFGKKGAPSVFLGYDDDVSLNPWEQWPDAARASSSSASYQSDRKSTRLNSSH